MKSGHDAIIILNIVLLVANFYPEREHSRPQEHPFFGPGPCPLFYQCFMYLICSPISFLMPGLKNSQFDLIIEIH